MKKIMNIRNWKIRKTEIHGAEREKAAEEKEEILDLILRSLVCLTCYEVQVLLNIF